MKKLNASRKIFVILFIAIFCMMISVIWLMQYVENLLAQDAEINLMEIVTQNKNVISSKLLVEVNNLDIRSQEITMMLKSEKPESIEEIRVILRRLGRQNGDDRLCIANDKGNVFEGVDQEINISGRRYYQYAMDGIPNFSEKLVSRVDGEEIFVVSAPIYYNEKVVGTVQKPYSIEEMNSICALSLFSEQGYMCIINSDGYVITHTPDRQLFLKSENYYHDIYATGNKVASAKLENGIKSNESGFLETMLNGQKIFSAYMPIEDIMDWYLVTSVPTGVVTANGNVVIHMFYGILFLVVIVLAFCFIYFTLYKNRQKKNIETIAFVDTVTGGRTYNKFLMDVPVILEKETEKQLYILKIDVNNFKFINSYYGYAFGDAILKKIYMYIEAKLHAVERICRLSADNFILLLEEASEERIQDLLYSIKFDEEANIYFSTGIYCITDRNESIALMVDKAGTAARAMKGVMNKRLVYYSDQFDSLTAHNEQLKHAVVDAIKNREFVPYYQPKVNIDTGRIVGAEALARWRKPDGTLVMPDTFIPMSESTGLVTEIDMLILEKVLDFQRRILKSGVKCIPISVNFSRLHLLDDLFPDKLEYKLKEYGIPPYLIEVELTESTFFDNMDTISLFADRLRKKGLALAMDDFGSGSSSLNMLKEIPIDALKIDKGFLAEQRNSELDKRRDIIFSSIVEMGQKLDILVVVEGVENGENVELMKKSGSVIAQGFYYAKPMEEAAFEEVYGKKIVNTQEEQE